MQNVIVGKRRDNHINWDTLFFVLVFHAFTIWALFNFSWANFAAAFVTWWIASSFGVGIGYHRLLTHRGFKTPKWFEYTLAFCGNLAIQSGAVRWVTTHRLHHAFTEQEQDPHSPREGTYWAHIGWIIRGTSQGHTEETIQRYAPDLAKDPIHRFLSKYYWVTPIIVGAILYPIGGWSMILWAIFARTTFAWHMTWLVNSATHIWGTRRFDTRDDSTNNGLIALVTFGEGWHNNHHAHPSSAKHGLAWYELDINWITIRLMEMVGLAKQVKVVDIHAASGKHQQPQAVAAD